MYTSAYDSRYLDGIDRNFTCVMSIYGVSESYDYVTINYTLYQRI